MSLLAKIIVVVLVVTAITLILSIIVRMRKQEKIIEESMRPDAFEDNDFTDTDEIITVRKYASEDEDVNQVDEVEMVSTTEPDKEIATEFDEEIATEPDHRDILIVNILAKPKQHFVGYELLQAILTAGLRFGEMDIFHRHQELSGQGSVLFSLANATEPGTFDLQKMGSTSCQGLILFLRLTNDPVDDLEHFELLIQTAEQLCEDLDGDLYDARRKLFTAQTVENYKQRINAQTSKVSEADESVTV